MPMSLAMYANEVVITGGWLLKSWQNYWLGWMGVGVKSKYRIFSIKRRTPIKRRIKTFNF